MKHVEDEQERKSGAAKDVNTQSQIYTATEDTLFTKTTSTLSRTHSLSLEWVFGMNPALPAISLQDHNQLVILYAGAHIGVIYNHTLNSQYMLQGHCHSISCMCVSEDRRWIATADQGPKSMVMMWDAFSGIPLQTLFNCHPERGIAAIALSSNTELLVTLGAEEIQRICIWKWMDETESPLWCTELKPKHGFQGNIIFNPNDNTQLLSCSESHILFYNTALKSPQVFALPHKKVCKTAPRGCDNAPDISEIVNLPAESLNLSVFHCKKPLILRATSAGSLMLWDVSAYLTETKEPPKVKCKILPLQIAPITCLATTDSYIVTGDTEGHIIFYDEGFKLLIRYVEYSLDAIISISFSKEFTVGPLENYSPQAEQHIIRTFIVTTVSSILHVKTKEHTTQILLKKDCEPLRAVACHPKQSTVAMGNGSGLLQLWDYSSKTIVCSRFFENEKIQCIAIDSQALYMAVGFESGAVHIVNPETLESCPDDCLYYGKASIHLLAFSLDSTYFATADAGNAVTVFRLQIEEGSLHHWTCLGRYCSHYKPIRDLLFGVHPNSSQPRLLSLGMERRLVEYDLQNSTVDNLIILSSMCIEQTAVPMCMVWYPPLTGEDFLLTASDHYKMKLYDSTSLTCRKTILGPTYGSPVEKVLVLPMSEDTNKYYLAYITKDKLGLQILPMDGNPYKSSTLICHPSGVSTLACSYDGRFAFTAGSSDCTVLSWEINLNALEAAAALGGTDMEPFYTMLEGGREGNFYREMEAFFFYCQLHSQGIDTMEKRQISTKIPLTEVASLMRALAYFPTNHEIRDMENEVKFSEFAKTGTYVTSINLEEFIKLYINHRPVLGICEEFVQAFHVLSDIDSAGELVLQKQELLKMLEEQGETMPGEEVLQCFTALLVSDEQEEEEKQEGELEHYPEDAADTSDGGSEFSLKLKIPDEISLEVFTCDILGFSPLQKKSGSPSSQE